MSVVVELTLGALRGPGAPRFDRYAACLRRACAAFPPPFGMAWYGEKYRDLALDQEWVAVTLVANAVKEAEGARDLWRLAGRIGDETVAEKVRLHAVDESRHAQLYVAMLEVAFGAALPVEVRPALRGVSPRYSQHDRPPAADILPERCVMDAIIQMNLGEIRTRIHQLLLTPIITEYCPGERRGTLGRVLRSLMRDETRHIEYTAELIEAAIAEGQVDTVERTLMARLDEFNQLTLSEVGESCFTGS